MDGENPTVDVPAPLAAIRKAEKVEVSTRLPVMADIQLVGVQALQLRGYPLSSWVLSGLLNTNRKEAEMIDYIKFILKHGWVSYSDYRTEMFEREMAMETDPPMVRGVDW